MGRKEYGVLFTRRDRCHNLKFFDEIRPRIVGRKQCGALFTHSTKYNNLKFFLSSVPVLGIIFLSPCYY